MAVNVDIVVDYIQINQCMETTADIVAMIPVPPAPVNFFPRYRQVMNSEIDSHPTGILQDHPSSFIAVVVVTNAILINILFKIYKTEHM